VRPFATIRASSDAHDRGNRSRLTGSARLTNRIEKAFDLPTIHTITMAQAGEGRVEKTVE
jgi:hypothetical protein